MPHCDIAQRVYHRFDETEFNDRSDDFVPTTEGISL